MSLDKLKSGWDSLNDSVDKKEIVTIKKMRKESYEFKYNTLKSQQMWSPLVVLFVLCIPLIWIYIPNEIYIITIILYLVMIIGMVIIFYIDYVKFNKIKMGNDIHILKRDLSDYIEFCERIYKIGFVVGPIFSAVVISQSVGPSPYRTTIIIVILSLTCCVNNYLSLSTLNKSNKKLNSMLEDIKQLEELDMY